MLTLDDQWQSDFWVLTAQGQLGYIYGTISIESVPSQKTRANSEYAQRINRVIDYLRGNLDRPVKLKELAKVACFSEFHLQAPLGCGALPVSCEGILGAETTV